jgi:hypothetical protein
MNKRLVITALLVTALFMAGYLAWSIWINPRPVAVAGDSQSAPQAAAPAVTPNPTIVAATLNKDGIPEKLGTLKLGKSELGKDALKEFESLHGKAFELVGGYKADYSGSGAQATLWVGQAKDSAGAELLTKEMVDKIGQGNPIFTDLNEMSISNRTIYQVSGQGQSHFFYAVNDKIVWLAATPDYAPDALHSIWSAIK